jgi:predicted GNAT family N-acyltransferase
VSIVVRAAVTSADRLASWRLRELVFIAEQGISEDVERDGLDDLAWHLVAWDGEEAVGTARVLGLDTEHRPIRPEQAAVVKIGRMAVLSTKRRLGIGRRLLEAALDLARSHGVRRAELSAQQYVVPFYERTGFRAEGEVFEEAGIPHRRMSYSFLPS